ncbi:MAG: MarR family transcriptional regulator, partial [Acidimicrobiales bacterium]
DVAATRAWTALQDYVETHRRRHELQEILGLGRGFGRVKLLLRLIPGPLTLREIADASGTDAPYATVIVDKLEGLGLVERTAHPDDNRRKLVQLTDAGRDAADRAAQILAEPPEGFANLSAEDLIRLEEILHRLSGESP